MAVDVVHLEAVAEVEARRGVHDRVGERLRRLVVDGDGEVRAAHGDAQRVPLLHREVADGFPLVARVGVELAGAVRGHAEPDGDAVAERAEDQHADRLEPQHFRLEPELQRLAGGEIHRVNVHAGAGARAELDRLALLDGLHPRQRRARVGIGADDLLLAGGVLARPAS